VRIAALALVAVTFLCACSADPQGELSLAPTPTATVDPLIRWLTEERQERLADTVTTLAKEHKWAAGCVFHWNADESVVDEFPRPFGTAAYSFVNNRELRPAIVVYVEGQTIGSGSFNEVVPDGVTFCYVLE
jgi:hypothetical protein